MDLKTLKEKSGYDLEYLKMKLEEIKRNFDHVINDEGALILLAKELGVEIDETKRAKLKLEEISEGLNNFDVEVVVKRVFPKKEFNSNGKTGFLQNLIVGDDKKEFSLTIWNKDYNLEIGDKVILKNVYVKKYKDNLQLIINENAAIEKIGKEEIKPLKTKVSELKPGQRVSLEGVVRYKQPLREFSNDKNSGKILKFAFYDTTGRVNLIFWNEFADKYKDLEENTKIKIINGVVKLNRNGQKEIHVNSDIEILGSANIDVPLKKLSELAYDEYVKVKAKLVSLERVYNKDVCSVCGNAMELKDGRLFCNNCNDYTTPNKKIVLVYKIDDSTAELNAVFFTKQAFYLLHADETNIDSKIESDDVLGMEKVLYGRLKKSQYSDDFIVSKIE